VVDSDLRVHGITGLRVADASVMRSIRSSNTIAKVYAERAADRISETLTDDAGQRVFGHNLA
jgi:choline dehydrogenase